MLIYSGMEYAVRYQHEKFGGNLKPGDHILTNHPLAGGTHLPDITIVTPVWDGEDKSIIFYVASRGHHGKHEALPLYFYHLSCRANQNQLKSAASPQDLCLQTAKCYTRKVP